MAQPDVGNKHVRACFIDHRGTVGHRHLLIVRLPERREQGETESSALGS